MRKFLLFIVVFLFFGCNKFEERGLNAVEEAIILDHVHWLDNRFDLVEQMAKDSGITDDLSDLLTQTWNADYVVYEGETGKTIATANTFKDEIVFRIEHSWWDYITEDYLYYSDLWDTCEHTRHYGQASVAAEILCHENGHLIGVKPHDDVYELGHICREAWDVDLEEWQDDCND